MIAIQFSADSTTASLTLGQVPIALIRPPGSLGYETETTFQDPANGYSYRTTLYPDEFDGQVLQRGSISEYRVCPTSTVP